MVKATIKGKREPMELEGDMILGATIQYDATRDSGKASFTEEQLADNFQTLIDAILKAKPATLKGAYLKSVTMTSTMGPGVKLNVGKLIG